MNEDLKTRLNQKSDIELVALVESNPGDYTKEAIDIAKSLLASRPIDESTMFQIARDLMKDQILNYLKSFDVINDKFEMPKSNLLTEEEVRSIFSQTFTQWKIEQDDMIPDGWQYVLAAGLG